MKKSYDNASAKIDIVDVKSSPEILDQAKILFAKKYPEFAHEAEAPEFVEDFEAQLSDDGFFLALIDPATKEVQGFTAGVVFESNTAALTYYILPEDINAAKKLQDSTLAALNDNGVRAVFVELFDKDNERDAADREAFQRMGAIAKVPVAYTQPLEPENELTLEDISLHVLFMTPGLAPAQKTAITLEHFDAYTRFYDAALENPANTEALARYQQSLSGANWGAGVKPGIKKDF